MSCSVQKTSLIVLLLIGLSSLDGKKGEIQRTFGERNFRPVLIAPKDHIIFKTKVSHGVNINGLFRTDFHGSNHIRKMQQIITDLQVASEIKIERLPLAKVTTARHLLDSLNFGQKLSPGDQILTNAKEENNVRTTDRFKIAPKNRPERGNRILLNVDMDYETNFEGSLPSLWKRMEDQYTEIKKGEKDRQKAKGSNHHSNTGSKLKVMFHPITDAFSKAKHKIKLNPTTLGTPSKTTTFLSVGSRGEDAIKSGPGKGLTSGYSSKPSGLGQTTSEYPGKGFLDTNHEASHPLEQTQTVKRRLSKLFSSTKRDTDEIESTERSPPRSPSKSYEKRKMRDYIDGVQKRLADNENVPASKEESLPPEQTQTIQPDGSQSPLRTKSSECQAGKRKDFLLVNTTPSSKHFHSPNIRTMEGHLDHERREDQNIINYIIYCKKLWKEAGSVLPAEANNQLQPDHPTSPTFRSPPRSIRGSPRQSSMILKPPLSPSRNPSSLSNRPLLSDLPLNPKQQLGELSNKEINDHYTALATKIKSDKQLGQKLTE